MSFESIGPDDEKAPKGEIKLIRIVLAVIAVAVLIGWGLLSCSEHPCEGGGSYECDAHVSA